MAKMTPEELAQSEMDFEAGFNEDQPAAREMSEDEAFGLAQGPAQPFGGDADRGTTEPMGDEVAAPAAPAAEESTAGAEPAPGPSEQAEAASAEGEGDEGDGAAPSVTVEIETSAADGTDVAPDGQGSTDENANGDEPTDPKDIQRAKSWEGRLRKMEEDLKARAAQLEEREKSMGAGAAEPAAGEAPVAESVESAIEQVEDGTMTPEQAIKTLTEDFGPEFAKLLTTLIESKATEIANRAADERVGKMGQTMDQLISELVDDKQSDHFEAISEAHEDFEEFAESDAFKSYIDSLGPDERAAAIRTIENGSARKIIKLLSAAKAASADQAAQPDEPAQDASASAAADAAEGVRSAGLRIPEEPRKADGYEEAWNEF